MSSPSTSQSLFFASELVDDNESNSSFQESIAGSFDLDYEQLSPSQDGDCNCGETQRQRANGGLESVALEEAPLQQVRIQLFTIRNWPEFKVDMEKQCRKVFGRKICANVPHAYQRTCSLQAFAEVSHPSAESIKADIADCVRKAVAAGVVAGVLAGNVAAAIAALKVSLIACLTAKGKSQLDSLGVNIRTESTCGEWKPR